VAQRLDAATEEDVRVADRGELSEDVAKAAPIEPMVWNEFAEVKASDQSRAPASQSEATA
jgi:hypothetical protein